MNDQSSDHRAARACEAEVLALHRALAGWLNGTAARAAAEFARLADRLEADFTIVSTAGKIMTRHELLSDVEPAHGAVPGLQIEIKAFRLVMASAECAVGVYEEWKHLGDDRKGKLSTALFVAAPGSPHGYRWRHLHETWLPTAD